jgi:hypothetical protein
MKTVQNHISNAQLTTALHPLFARMDRQAALGEVLPMVAGVSGWVLAQPEVMKRVDAEMKDLKLRKVARFYRARQAKQGECFRQDVVTVEGGVMAVGPQHAVATAAAAAVMAEVEGAESDAERLVVLQAVEAANFLLVEAVATYCERMGVGGAMKYFCQGYLEAMGEHQVLAEQIDAIVASLELTDAQKASATARVDRIFAAFRSVLDGCETVCADAARKPAVRLAARVVAAASSSRIAA